MADSEIELPQILDHLYDWCSNWLLELNASKTQISNLEILEYIQKINKLELEECNIDSIKLFSELHQIIHCSTHL